MKKTLFTIMCLSQFIWAQAQVNVQVGTGVRVTASGPVNVNIGAGSVTNNGVWGDTSGTVNVTGSVMFGGIGVTNLNKLNVNAPGDTATFNSVATVKNNIDIYTNSTVNAGGALTVGSGASLLNNGVLYNNVPGLVAMATVASGGCPSFTSVLSLNVSGSVMNYQWQSAPDSLSWTNIAGATNATYTATVTSTAYYRCALATTNSIFSEATPGVKLRFTGTGPLPIAGISTFCYGTTTSLSDATPAGTWSSSAPTVATIGSTGLVNGVGAGTATIVYNTGCGTPASLVITVDPLPVAGAISGPAAVCQYGTIALTETATGGYWSSTNPSIASVDAFGNVTGVNGGSATIKYTVVNTCGIEVASQAVAVNTVAAITGGLHVCKGGVTTLADITPGSWSSSDATTASIDGGGNVTGVAAGAVVISYLSTAGCLTSAPFNVYPISPVVGPAVVCAGSSITLTDSVADGTWTTASSLASVSATTGVVTGISAGAPLISYVTPEGCVAIAYVTINPTPGAILGTHVACAGFSTTLADLTAFGTWSSSNLSVATVSGTGLVAGVASGTSLISYTLGTGCYTTQAVTIESTPTAIFGPTAVCAGAGVSLSDTSAGGVWESNNIGVATINATTGAVTGIAGGNAVISYTNASTGCYTVSNFTVNPSAPIAGSLVVCAGLTTGLSNPNLGGAWVSNNTAVATISGTGVVTGVTAGTSLISYTLTTGCMNTAVVMVNPAVPAITGTTAICQGTYATLSNTTLGGTWSSSNTAVDNVNESTGVVFGLAAGSNSIVYTLPTGCSASIAFTVNANPVVYTVTGGGTYNKGDAGEYIYLSGSQSGTTYKLYGTVNGFAMEGNGGPLTWGPDTATGLYSVVAKNDTTGCSSPMGGAVTIAENTLATPVVPGADIAANFTLYPNPNNGVFTLKGNLGSFANVNTTDQETYVEVLDLMGQVVYEHKVTVANGAVDEKMQLGKDVANGMYLLVLHYGAQSGVMHMEVAQ